MIEVLFAAAGLVEAVGEGVADAEGAGVGTETTFSCESFTFTVGFENVNPFAESFSQPSRSTSEVVATLAWPSEEVTETEACIGASVKRYRQRATSPLIIKL